MGDKPVPVADNPPPEYDLVRIHFNKAKAEGDPNYRPWIIKHGQVMYRVNSWDIHGKSWGVYDPNPNEQTHGWLECRAIVIVENDRALIITESAEIKEKEK